MAKSSQKSLTASSLIKAVYEKFFKIPDPRSFGTKPKITFIDCLMSALAVFGLKFPSLLQYDRKRKDPEIESNLKNLYHVQAPPSDTYLGERLDELDPNHLRPAFKKIFSKLQRSKKLENFEFLDGYYLLSLDGTGEFSSGNISCPHCCKKEHKSGKVTYYHQMLGGCIVHPEQSNVIPLCPEMIHNMDGNTKNDCERNASKRFIEHFRREHPHLKVIVIEDGLASNAPHIKHLEQYNMKYILGAKQGDHKFLFDLIGSSDSTKYFEMTDERGYLHQFRFVNNVSLNKAHPALKVNFWEYRETDPQGKELNFSWVTNIRITKKNIHNLTIGGRARWKIENETYNTLKNLGYNFKHNYGHGKEHLSSVFCLLMILAFLIDQVQEIACLLFRMAKKRAGGSYRGLWEEMRVLFRHLVLHSWEMLYQKIAKIPLKDSS
jgi:hypothetical protein